MSLFNFFKKDTIRAEITDNPFTRYMILYLKDNRCDFVKHNGTSESHNINIEYDQKLLNGRKVYREISFKVDGDTEYSIFRFYDIDKKYYLYSKQEDLKGMGNANYL